MDFYSRIFEWSWTIPLSYLRLDKLFRVLKGRKLSFGIWFRVTTDRVTNNIAATGINQSKDFIYQALDTGTQAIRIFVLHPGALDDPISGELVHAYLDAKPAPEYEAVSYVWGDPASEKSNILIDGHRISILPNLASALLHLRLPDKPRRLWIDSLCINQNDVHERNIQVAAMRNIFTSASNVVIWLGPSTPNSALGLQILSYLADTAADLENRPLWATRSPKLLQDGLRDIMAREWFWRIWVVQEAALARRAIVTCGRHHSFAWTFGAQTRLFMRRIKFAALSPAWQQAGLDTVNVSPLIQLLELGTMAAFGRQEMPDLLDVAYQLRHRQSTDPRDKLFALAGLAGRNGEVFEVDYAQTMEEISSRLLRMCRDLIMTESSVDGR